MNRSVDLVIVGLTAAARSAAIAAARGGRSVLVVGRTNCRSRCRRFRRDLAAGLGGARRQVSVLTGVEVACADGAPGIEAVVLRRIRSGRLIAVNARALLVTTLVTTRVAAGLETPGWCQSDEFAARAARAQVPG